MDVKNCEQGKGAERAAAGEFFWLERKQLFIIQAVGLLMAHFLVHKLFCLGSV